MQEDIYTRIHRVLSWQRIVAFNVVLFLVLAVPISVRLAQQRQETRSSAADDEAIVSEPTPPPNYPAQPPVIERVQMFYGKAGDVVVLLGRNFGEYQWGSSVFVGNVRTEPSDIVRWSDRVIEVTIPEAARTGRVWVSVNGKQAAWEGSLLLYDLRFATKVGLQSYGASQVGVWVEKGDAVASGLIEIGYTSGNPNVIPNGAIEVEESTILSDSFGQKVRVRFKVNGTLSRAKTEMMTVNFGQPSRVEVLRAELYDQSLKLIDTYSDPFSVVSKP